MSHVESKLETRTLESKTGVIALFSAMVVTLLAFAAIATGTAFAQEAEVAAQEATVQEEAATIVHDDCGVGARSARLAPGAQNGGSS